MLAAGSKHHVLSFMLKYHLKQWLKKNDILYSILSCCIKAYLSLVYSTIRWQYKVPQGYDFNGATRTIFAMWHDNLATAPYAFRSHKNLYALVSPHSDGKIISKTLVKFGYHIIEGSTNKNPAAAARQIIKNLSKNRNIAITPDGPRGPKHEVHSNIVGLAKIALANIVPVSCKVERYFCLESWDALMMPLPFCRGIITIGAPLILSENDELGSKQLEDALNSL